jgi:hypothetical protein
MIHPYYSLTPQRMLSFQRRRLTLLVGTIMLFCFSCKKTTPPPSVSFYYWKTKFELNEAELQTLSANQVKQLYVRYFDIAYNKEQQQALPIGVIQMKQQAAGFRIIPVVYIKNEVFLKANEVRTDSLSIHVFNLISQISQPTGQQPEEVQFDCDWTESTKGAYFKFLKAYKNISHQALSATIRLHQIKYPQIMGIPPVDHGVLMFYNMGKIDASDHNSVYDASVAASYLNQLNAYPLKMDVALPVFSWSIQIRSGEVVHLLNKMDTRHFNKDTCFQLVREHRFKVVQSCFKGGYYFKKDDEVKVEQITADDLKAMAQQITAKTKQPISQILFYDLDSFNLNNYDTKTFERTAHLFN